MKTDMELQRDVLDEIAWEPSTCAPEIEITVHDGVVTLTGSVDNLPAKRAAENAALIALWIYDTEFTSGYAVDG